LFYYEMVVFQLSFFNRRPIRLWQRVLALWGGDNGTIRVFTAAAFAVVSPPPQAQAALTKA
jgi:hypothetical protein